jgi:tetratricopeptide (TPR) repeat protein
MTTRPPVRRVLCGVVSLTIAAFAFHTELASAIVTRGDDAMRNGDIATAERAYGRALWLDAGSPVAADRLAFGLIMQHDRAKAERAKTIASKALEIAPRDAALLADRAFARMQCHEWAAAGRDFASLAVLTRDARYEHFASRMALRAGDRRAARAHALSALRRDPAFAPSRVLLRTLR